MPVKIFVFLYVEYIYRLIISPLYNDYPFSFQKIADSTISVGDQISRIESGDNDIHSSHPIKPKIAKTHEVPPSKFEYGNREVILYALGGKLCKSLLHNTFNGRLALLGKWLVYAVTVMSQ